LFIELMLDISIIALQMSHHSTHIVYKWVTILLI